MYLSLDGNLLTGMERSLVYRKYHFGQNPHVNIMGGDMNSIHGNTNVFISCCNCLSHCYNTLPVPGVGLEVVLPPLEHILSLEAAVHHSHPVLYPRHISTRHIL